MSNKSKYDRYSRYGYIKRKFIRFCQKNNFDYEDVAACFGFNMYNFPFWYVDYQRYMKNEIKNRIRTGVVTKFNYRDVWS